MLEVGAVVIAEHTLPKWAPHKVKDKWVNTSGTLARLLMVKGKNQWVDATPWRRAPAGNEWSRQRGWHIPVR